MIDYGIRQRTFPGNPCAPNRPLPSNVQVHGRRVVYPSSRPVLERVQIQSEPSRHDESRENHAVGSSSRQGIGLYHP